MNQSADRELFLEAERALLASEGIEAQQRTIELSRLGSQARVVETGEGPPVLFVSGVMTTGVTFASLVGQLEGFRCIMLDRPGTGLSPQLDPPPADLDRQQEVADTLLVDVLDGLGIEQSHVVCTSMGGWFAFRSIAAHRDRFLRLSALSFQIGARMTKLPASMRMPAISWLTPKRVKATPRLVRASLKTAGMRNAVESGKFSDEMADYMAATMRYTDTFGNEALFSPRPGTMFGPTERILFSEELLAKVDLPAHLLWGTDDLFGGEASAREFAGKLPNAELQMVDGAGHAPWFDEPELAAKAVQTHLTS